MPQRPGPRFRRQLLTQGLPVSDQSSRVIDRTAADRAVRWQLVVAGSSDLLWLLSMMMTWRPLTGAAPARAYGEPRRWRWCWRRSRLSLTARRWRSRMRCLISVFPMPRRCRHPMPEPARHWSPLRWRPPLRAHHRCSTPRRAGRGGEQARNANDSSWQ